MKVFTGGSLECECFLPLHGDALPRPAYSSLIPPMTLPGPSLAASAACFLTTHLGILGMVLISGFSAHLADLLIELASMRA